MFAEVWTIARKGFLAFIEDDDLSRGAAIAFYAVTGFVPALIFVVAILSAVFGPELIRGVVAHSLYVLMGREGGVLMHLAAQSVSGSSAGVRAEIFGGMVLIVTASGAFSEIQTALNAVWKVQLQARSVAQLLRARMTSVLLVLGLGALLLVSVLATTAIALWAPRLHFELGAAAALLPIGNFLLSLALAAVLFAAIYKILPDIDLEWSDVAVGAAVTAFLYELGQVLIGIYFETQAGFTARGIAGGMIVLLLWIYYSAQVFLFGAEVTKVYAARHGSARQRRPNLVALRRPDMILH